MNQNLKSTKNYRLKFSVHFFTIFFVCFLLLDVISLRLNVNFCDISFLSYPKLNCSSFRYFFIGCYSFWMDSNCILRPKAVLLAEKDLFFLATFRNAYICIFLLYLPHLLFLLVVLL
jgi:hypothetical protein